MSARAGAWATDLRAMRARTVVRVLGTFRNPGSVFMDALLPNLGMCAYVLLYRALGAPKSYEALAVIGGVLTTYWLSVLWGMGAQLYWEKQAGQLQLYFAAPCSRMAILTGMALGGLASTVLRSLVGVAIGFFFFHIRFEAVDGVQLAAVFVITMCALWALGMAMASLFLLYGREAWHLCNALVEPVYFATGLFFPIRTLGLLGSVMAAVIPLTLGVDALRQILLGPAAHGLLPLRLEILAQVAFFAVFLLLARWLLRVLENLSKQEGRLTLRWD